MNKKYNRIIETFINATALNTHDKITAEEKALLIEAQKIEKKSDEIINEINEITNFANTLNIAYQEIDEYNNLIDKLGKTKKKLQRTNKKKITAMKIGAYVKSYYQDEFNKK